jgi:hypothetical protein
MKIIYQMYYFTFEESRELAVQYYTQLNYKHLQMKTDTKHN